MKLVGNLEPQKINVVPDAMSKLGTFGHSPSLTLVDVLNSTAHEIRTLQNLKLSFIFGYCLYSHCLLFVID